MSNVAEQIDLKSSMIQWLGALTSFFVKDLKALPEEQILACPGGCAHTPQQITSELISLNQFTINVLRGVDPGEASEEGFREKLAGLTTKDQLVEAFQDSCRQLSEAISNAPDDIWTREIMAPWQMKDSVWGITNITINHIWYHDGQINTYQCLLGDDKVHWMD